MMQLAAIFQDHMVLQREQPIAVFGTGEGSGNIRFCGTETAIECTAGKFLAYLPAQQAGGPYEMTVTLDGETVTFTDILVGDVFIAGGQSNMEYPLRGTADIELVEQPLFRHFKEPHSVSDDKVVTESVTHWELCNAETAPGFSAIAYYCALRLIKETGIPVGIIYSNKGASRVDAWTDPAITGQPDYQAMVADHHRDYDLYRCNHDGLLYTHKILPIAPYTVAGVLWYQGESNRGLAEAPHYATLLQIMVENWRELWQAALPFYCIQLAPYGENPQNADIAMIRQQQMLAAKTVPGVCLITCHETGEAHEIHPVHKRALAEATANAVLTRYYGQEHEYSGPVIEAVTREGNRAVCTFSHARELVIRGEALTDAVVYDAAGNTYPATGKVEEGKLVLTWAPTADVIGVRLGYQNAPKHNLYNATYLACPFDWTF